MSACKRGVRGDQMISIVVPCFNCESTLERCCDSILKQTQKDFELILVDDGSTDLCSKICDDFAQKDSRIIVIHKKNEGLVNARKSGCCNVWQI